MQEIIAHVEQCVRSTVPFDKEAFLTTLDVDSHLHWKVHFPVAVVHHKSRMDAAAVTRFEDEHLLNDDGFTEKTYDKQVLKTLCKEVPKAFKQVDALCMSKAHDSYRYEPKRPGDKWKKLVDDDSFKAVVEVSVYHESADICQIETDLRDLMRSSKEVPSLKPIGFVWVASLPASQNIATLLSHYFGDCFLEVEHEKTHTYIGWSETLGGVDMRHFVCPPAKEQK